MTPTRTTGGAAGTTARVSGKGAAGRVAATGGAGASAAGKARAARSAASGKVPASRTVTAHGASHGAAGGAGTKQTSTRPASGSPANKPAIARGVTKTTKQTGTVRSAVTPTKTRTTPAKAGKAAPSKAAASKAAAGKVVPGKSAAGKATAGKAPATKAPATKASAADTATDKATAGKAPAGKSAAGRSAAGKAPAGKAATAVKPTTKVAKVEPAPLGNGKVPHATRVAGPSAGQPGPYAGDAKFMAEQQTLLLSERLVYESQASDLKAEADSLAQEREPGDVQFDEESGEGGTVTVDRERDLALSAQATAAVEEIDAALARIEDRSYGGCERCHLAIPKPRLKALPYARLCVACKSGGLSRR